MKKNFVSIAFLLLSTISCSDSLEGISGSGNNYPKPAEIAFTTPSSMDGYVEMGSVIGHKRYLSGLLKVSIKLDFTKSGWTKAHIFELKEGDILSFRGNLESKGIESDSFEFSVMKVNSSTP